MTETALHYSSTCHQQWAENPVYGDRWGKFRVESVTDATVTIGRAIRAEDPFEPPEILMQMISRADWIVLAMTISTHSEPLWIYRPLPVGAD